MHASTLACHGFGVEHVHLDIPHAYRPLHKAIQVLVQHVFHPGRENHGQTGTVRYIVDSADFMLDVV